MFRDNQDPGLSDNQRHTNQLNASSSRSAVNPVSRRKAVA